MGVAWCFLRCLGRFVLKTRILPVFTRTLEARGRRFPPSGRTSGALLPEALLRSLGDQFRQPHQVVGCATEDEQPIDLVQSAQLHLADRAGLLEPSKSFFDQPSAAQADGVAGMPRGSTVEVGAASLLVPGHMRGDVQGARGRDEILGVVGLVRAYGDATPAAFSLVLKHQQRSLALGVAVGLVT